MSRRQACLVIAATSAAMMRAAPVRAELGTNAMQRQWVASHRSLRFAPEADYGPFVFTTADGTVTGLSIDLLRLAAAAVGLDWTMQPARPLKSILDGLKQRESDFTSSLRPTPERAGFLQFTRPYVEVPAVLVGRKDSTIAGLAGLAGRPVAVGTGYAVQTPLAKQYPQVAWRPLADDASGLDAVAAGLCDAAVLDLASLAHLERARPLSAFTVIEPVGFLYQLAFAARSDWPELAELLDLGLSMTPRTERQRVLERWLGPHAQRLDEAGGHGPALRIGGGLLAAGVLVGTWAWWRGRRRRAADARLR